MVWGEFNLASDAIIEIARLVPACFMMGMMVRRFGWWKLPEWWTGPVEAAQPLVQAAAAAPEQVQNPPAVAPAGAQTVLQFPLVPYRLKPELAHAS